jgi:hypothetical protein
VDCVIVLGDFHHDIISLGRLKDQKETEQASATCSSGSSCSGIRDDRMSRERQEYLKNYEAWKEHELALSTKRQLAYLYSKYHEVSKEMHASHPACFMNSHES